ncbi:MAG: glycosyltransferase [Candidatus Gracilibacteria bacterium]|nr:glycosyltransferase [Candidatus Gracilibacteria bacterium]
MKTLLTRYKKIIKFGFVGISSTLIDIGFLYFFVEILYLNLFISIIFSFLLAVLNGFTWNKIWTFTDTSVRYKRQFIKFLFVSIGGLILTISFMYFFHILFGIYYLLAKLFTSGMVVIWNFLGNKYWTFKISDALSIHNHKNDLKYSIIVPAYNEENRIGHTLTEISKYFSTSGATYEIIIVDDGSIDNTITMIQQLELPHIQISKNIKNRGKGFSVKQGVNLARGEYILFTDADNSTPIKEIQNLEKYIDKYSIVIGSRYCKNSNIKVSQKSFRKNIGRIGNMIIQFFLLEGIKDTQCGFKLFQHNVAKKIFSVQKIHGFGFDMEILLAGRSMGFNIKEVPVLWINSEDSRVRPIRDSIKTLGELIFIKINYWFDGYK